MKKLTAFIFMLLLSSCASQQERTYMGYKVIEMPYTISGGEVVILQTTDAGPIPAEGGGFKVEVAGFSVGKSTSIENKAELIWQFAISTTNNFLIKELTIEEVSPSDVVVPLVSQETPQFINGVWRTSLTPVEANSTSTPFLFSDSPSIFVFRVTITLESQQQVVLYQPAWFSIQSKVTYQKMIVRIKDS